MKKQTNRKWIVLVLLFASLTGMALRGGEPAAEPKSGLMKFLEQDYLLGTWGGGRTWLSEHGADFEFVWFGAVPSNVKGGIKTGTEWEGALLMMMTLDSQKLAGYHGGTFAASSLWMHNTKEFSPNYIGDFNKVSLLDFPDMLRLWELYYEQKFFSDKVSLKFGQLAIDRDFILPEFYNSLAGITFLNQTFFYPTLAFNVWDVPGLPRGHHALASTPYGAPGVRLRVDPTERWVVQFGAYDGLPELHDSGVRINLNDQEGALLYFELGYRLNQAKGDTGLKGNLKLGGYYHTDDFQDINQATRAAFGAFVGPVRQYSGNYGFYFLADQQLYQEVGRDDPASQGLVGFFRVAGAPPDRNLAQFGIDGGLVYKGLLPGRDWDTLGLAGSYLGMSDDLADAFDTVDALAGLGLPTPDYEAAIELSYKAQLTAWWTLQPSIQYTFHPGGRTAFPSTPDDSLAIILMTTLRF